MTTPTTHDPSRIRRWWRCAIGAPGTPVDARNQARLLLWTLGWGVTYLGATWLLAVPEPGHPAPLRWALVAVAVVTGAGAVRAYLRFLRDADELRRRIEMEGLAFGFGVGVAGAIAWGLAELAGAPQLDVTTAGGLTLVAYAVGQVRAMRRYR